jgi:hypothetical protein
LSFRVPVAQLAEHVIRNYRVRPRMTFEAKGLAEE